MGCRSVHIGQRTNSTHPGAPPLPSHPVIAIYTILLIHGPRSYPSVASQAPWFLCFIQPWLRHSKSQRILLRLWQAFYLKSSWNTGSFHDCQQLKNCHLSVQVWNHKWAEVVPFGYYKSPKPLGRRRHRKKSRRGYCSIYRTIWASSSTKVTPVYSLNAMAYSQSQLCPPNALWFHLYSPLHWKVKRDVISFIRWLTN